MTALRLLITGSRDWQEPETVDDEICNLIMERHPDALTVVHGDCPTGADQHATLAVQRLNDWFPNRQVTLETHPADWRTHGKTAGFIRNQAMVDLGADYCLAFIRNHSRGASDCASRAERANIRVRTFRR